jgi:hypothetical protein
VVSADADRIHRRWSPYGVSTRGIEVGPELARLVLAPTCDGAVAIEGARVAVSDRDVDRIRDLGHRLHRPPRIAIREAPTGDRAVTAYNTGATLSTSECVGVD